MHHLTKKLTALALFTALILFPATWVFGQTATAPAGDGTDANPYQIATLENLYWIAADDARWSVYYLQTADIDASATSSWDSSAGWTPIGVPTSGGGTPFSGTYDGSGHTISGLSLDRPGANHQGLFGFTAGATIMRLGLINVSIIGGNSVGALVGKNTSGGSVTNCHATGAVTGNENVGGLVGYNETFAKVENSYAGATVSGNASVGGLVGYNETGEISNSYATGNVTRKSESTNEAIGAFCGNIFSGTIENSYSIGSVSYEGADDPSDKGFVGEEFGPPTYNNNFWDSDASNQTDTENATGATGKTTTKMKTQATFTDEGWDFDTVWDMDGTSNNGYPFLRNVTLAVPRITTQAVTDIDITTATGHGTITSLGSPNPTGHGVCWATTINPTTNDTCANLGAADTADLFTASIAGLTAGTTYHVRAFAANAAGTSYGENRTFTTLETYAVTYEPNGATSGSVPAAQTKTQGVDLALAANTGNLAKTGFTFAGWNTAADGTGTDYAEGATYSADAALTLYAKWTALPTNAVTYEPNGATSGSAPAAQTKTQGVDLTLAANSGNLSKTGHTFAGWNTAADGSGTDYAEGATYTTDAALTLYAQWTANTYTVTYNGNSADGGTTENSSHTYD